MPAGAGGVAGIPATTPLGGTTVTNSRVMKSASGAPMKGWHQRGTRFMDPGTQCFHEIDCEADGSISMKIPGRIAGTEGGEQAACDAVISALNGQGGNWGPSERAAGRETGVDRIAHMHGFSTSAVRRQNKRSGCRSRKLFATRGCFTR
jgi:hypothetical protein